MVLLWLSRLRLIPYIFWLLNWTKWYYSTEQSETDTATFSLKCLLDAQPNRCHSKYVCKAILQVEFSSCKVHTQPPSEMSKTQVTKWCVRQTAITLSIAPARLLFSSQGRGEEGKPLSARDRKAKCSCYLASSIREPVRPTSGSCTERKWS